jgi:hypothetical protein
MTQFTHSSLMLTILKQVSSDRLQHAVCGLAGGSMTGHLKESYREPGQRSKNAPSR